MAQSKIIIIIKTVLFALIIHIFLVFKLLSVTIVGVSPKFVKAILKSFGSELESLTFESCLELDLSDLLPCVKLESLFILSHSTLDPKAIGSNIIAHTFIPQLTSIESGICLSSWAFLFEGKSALTRVFLNCFHLGTVVSIHIYIYTYKDVHNIIIILKNLNRKRPTFSLTGIVFQTHGR